MAVCHEHMSTLPRDLTDAQWARLDSLIPEPPRRKDGRGRPWRGRREVLDGILFILPQAQRGLIFQSVILPTTLGIAAFSNGCALESCGASWRQWPRNCGFAEDSILKKP
jgi:hypothetical protein